MKKINLAIIFLVLIVLSACGVNGSNDGKETVDIHGYVLDKTKDSILVVSKDGGVDDYYDAIQLSNAPTEVRVGDEVKVVYKGDVQESYPLGGEVGHLEIMPEMQPQGAHLTQREAIAKALVDQHNVVIRSITFDHEAGMWTVELKGLHDGERHSVEVSDADSIGVGYDLSGFIIAKETERILIVNPDPIDFSDTGGVSAFYDASWVSTRADNVQLGDKVHVWFDGAVEDSYPTQATAKQVEILPPVIHEDALLTESEALGQVLEGSSHEYNVLVVKSIEFDQANKQWQINCLDPIDGKMYEFQVADK